MKRKTKLNTRYQRVRYQLRGALGLLEWLLAKETDDGILTTSHERAEVHRFIATARREGGFRS